jgi:uncharacterized protein YndB with AHSA1/START domain
MKWLKWVGIVLAALLVLPLLTLLVIGLRPGAGQIQASADIHASPDQLWSWVEDGAKLKQWVSSLVEVRPADPPQPGVGAKRVLKMRDENNGGTPMEIEATCSEYAPPSRLTMRLVSKDAFDGRQSYLLTDLGNGQTRVEIHSQFHFADRFAQLMEPLITPSARQKLVGDLARLKSLVESRAEAR